MVVEELKEIVLLKDIRGSLRGFHIIVNELGSATIGRPMYF
jgi:hypothetical protein